MQITLPRQCPYLLKGDNDNTNLEVMGINCVNTCKVFSIVYGTSKCSVDSSYPSDFRNFNISTFDYFKSHLFNIKLFNGLSSKNFNFKIMPLEDFGEVLILSTKIHGIYYVPEPVSSTEATKLSMILILKKDRTAINK